MINEIDNMLNEFESGMTLSINKITAVSEAAARELEINFKKCDLKVLTENGTDEDLAMLYEAAKESNKESNVKALEGFKNSIANSFNTISKTASNAIDTASNQETFSKLKEKIKFAPLLKNKEILSVDASAINKTAEGTLKQLDSIKAKIKSGVGNPSAEIETIMANYNKAMSTVSDSSKEVKKKIEAACDDCKAGMSKIAGDVNSAKGDAISAVNDAIELVKAGADPVLAKDWAKAKVEVIKAATSAKVNGLKRDASEITAAIKAYKTVQKDVADEAKDDKAVKEFVEEPETETPEEIVIEGAEDDTITEGTEEDIVTEGTEEVEVQVDLTPDTSDDLSEPVSMDGYGAALNMPDPVTEDDLDAELQNLEAECGVTESVNMTVEEIDDLSNFVLREAAIDIIGGEEALAEYVSESGANEHDALCDICAGYNIKKSVEEPTVESVYEELFGEPMKESSEEDLQNMFNEIFEEATNPIKQSMAIKKAEASLKSGEGAKALTNVIDNIKNTTTLDDMEKEYGDTKEEAVEESTYDSLMNAILAL